MSKVVNFSVQMTCSGCSGAVKRILSRIEGVKDVDANIETKVVAVSCDDSVESQVLLDALLKWASSSGKAVSLMPSE